MGRLPSALSALCLALLMGLAHALGMATQQAAGQPATAAAPTAPAPDATFVFYLPLLHGGCATGCAIPQTPTLSPQPTVTSVTSSTPAPPPISSPTALPTPPVSATPTPTYIAGTITLQTVADTFIVEGTSGQADANFGHYPGMFLGYDEQAWRRQRSLLRFDLDAIPKDALVVSATLQVYTHNCFHCKPMNVDVVRATGEWREEEATWNTCLTLPGEVYGRGVMVAPQRWVSLDVTRLVRDWTGRVPNDGVMLMAREDAPHDWWSIEAREDGTATAPRLVVSYLAPP